MEISRRGARAAWALGGLLGLGLLAAVLASPADGRSTAGEADAAFGARVKAYLLAHPEVLEEAMQKLEAVRDARAEATAAEGIRRNRDQLERDGEDFVANPTGRYTVVEFFDYKCPYCKTSADAVVKLIHDHPDVRFVFKEFPILTEASSSAALDQLLAAPKGRYVETFQALMDQKNLDAETTAEVFRTKGLDLAALDTPEARAKAQKHLDATRALAHVVGVEGTPAFIVGDKRIDGWQPEVLETAVQAERDAKGKAPA